MAHVKLAVALTLVSLGLCFVSPSLLLSLFYCLSISSVILSFFLYFLLFLAVCPPHSPTFLHAHRPFSFISLHFVLGHWPGSNVGTCVCLCLCKRSLWVLFWPYCCPTADIIPDKPSHNDYILYLNLYKCHNHLNYETLFDWAQMPNWIFFFFIIPGFEK